MTIRLNSLAGYNSLYKNKFEYNKNEFKFQYDIYKSLHDDLIDEILYFQDILSINDEEIVTAVLNSLLYYYICPLLLGSLYNYKYFFQKNENDMIKYIVSPEISLYIFTLIFSNIHNDTLLNLICSLLFKKEINSELITNYINIHYIKNYFYEQKEQNNKEKN